MTIASDMTCTDLECTFAEDGLCTAGIDPPLQCPKLRKANVEQMTPASATKTTEVINLPSGEALSPEEASLITRAHESRVVLIAGAHASGKTTLLASLYERFQVGPFGGFHFAGSNTLVAFEKRCFLSRMKSGRDKPDTKRTEFSESPEFLHLRVADVSGERPIVRDLLFTDIFGEAFRLARDSTEECLKMTTLKHADHVLLLVDGEKIIDVALRDVAVDDAMLLLRRAIECGMLGKRSLIDVVLTKLDKVQASPNRQLALDFWQRAHERMANRFNPSVGRIRHLETAARPEASSSLELAHGLAQPFESWINDSLLNRAVGDYPLTAPPAEREFDLFVNRLASMLEKNDA
jgi:hypothetical protein